MLAKREMEKPMDLDLDRTLVAGALAHLAGGVGAALLVALPATAVGGEHPAAKPMRFGLSIAVFLGSMAVLVPLLTIDRAVRLLAARALVITMAIEMVLIAAQALRGKASHFNAGTPIDGAIWRCMVAAIVVATATMAAIAVVASLRPLNGAGGTAVDPLIVAGWRFGLWCFLLSAVSGFGMGGAGRHSVGGRDGGRGVPILRFSSEHGDLRVSHFFSLHGLQILPLLAMLLSRAAISDGARWSLLAVAMGAQAAVAVGTLLQAYAARPSW